jgi:hypothetical protein
MGSFAPMIMRNDHEAGQADPEAELRFIGD